MEHLKSKEMEQKPKRYSDISPDMIRDWKAKHGEFALEELRVELDPETGADARFVLKVPSRVELMAYEANSDDRIKVNKMLVENSVLGGDMEALEQYGSVFARVLEWGANQIADFKPAETKKL